MGWKWNTFERDQTEKGYLITNKREYICLLKYPSRTDRAFFMAWFKRHPHSLSTAVHPLKEEEYTVLPVRLRALSVPSQYYWVVNQMLIILIQVIPPGHHSAPRQAGRSTLPPSHCITSQRPGAWQPTCGAMSRGTNETWMSPAASLCCWSETCLLLTTQAAGRPPQVRQWMYTLSI